MGELQAEAYRIEYDWQNISIVRPANESPESVNVLVGGFVDQRR